ncbi:MAG TPA: hypothetical protein VM933_10490 [Acidimicrobiales bacterium]|nr:hypothetical protein [Acidimicrobiales bacterium]
MTNPPSPILLVIGPSGSGKSTLVRTLAGAGHLRVHPTWTTRPRRPDEAAGSLEHRFVDDATFDRLQREGRFVDAVALFGLAHRYGLPPLDRPAHADDGCSRTGRLDTVMLRAPLVERFRRVFPDRPAVVVQVEDDPRRLRRRLLERGGTPDELAARLTDNRAEVLLGRRVADHVVVNDGTVDDLAARVLELVAPHTQASAA